MTPAQLGAAGPLLRGKGYRVLTPTYPGFEVEVEALREDPEPIATATVPATVAHIAGAINELDRPPIIMGHSFGGTLTQLLLDRGLGACGDPQEPRATAARPSGSRPAGRRVAYEALDWAVEHAGAHPVLPGARLDA
jgi:pimeloyl-ACP methyl ester carboxylesterase